MKKNWIRVAGAVTAVAGALTVGLTSASASATPAAGPTPPIPSTTAGQRSASMESPVIASGRLPSIEETSYIPIAPCRIVDTRLAGGPLASKSTRSFFVAGTSGFSGQGGHNAGCGIPVGATSVAATIGSTNSKGIGYLTAYPSGGSRPLASNVDYIKGQNVAIGGNISISAAAGPELSMFDLGASTDVFVDVSGYYLPKMQALVVPSGVGKPAQVLAGTDRVVSIDNPFAGDYQIHFDHDITACTPAVDTYSAPGLDDGSGYANAVTLDGDTAGVFTWRLDPTTHAQTAENYAFWISITC